MTAGIGALRRRSTGFGQRPFRRANPILTVPAILLLAIFYLLPNLLNLVLGFTDWNAFRDEIRLVGIDNFRRLVSTGVLATAISTTLVFAVTVMVIQNVMGLGLALGLERTTWLNGLLRTVFFVPVLISPVAAGYIFRGLLAPGGTVNGLLGAVVGEPVTVAWLGSREFTLFVVALIQAWKGMGITMLIYLAGLAAIPREYEEAARVDGASGGQVVRRIKLPLLAPALTANIVLTLIGAIGAFDIILATTKGGPGRATAVINYVLYQQFAQGLFGMATAVNLVIFVMVLIASVPLIVYLRRREVQL